MFDNTQEGVTITNRDTRILAVNKAFTEVTVNLSVRQLERKGFA